MGKNLDPGSGINIPDLQHWYSQYKSGPMGAKSTRIQIGKDPKYCQWIQIRNTAWKCKTHLITWRARIYPSVSLPRELTGHRDGDETAGRQTYWWGDVSQNKIFNLHN
jgi:hypothetical protein